MSHVLHHPKGTLMPSAPSRERARAWREHRLGSGAKLDSISEQGGMDSAESVERSGTGIRAASKEGCQPFASILPSCESMLQGIRRGQRDRGPLLRGSKPGARKPTWH